MIAALVENVVGKQVDPMRRDIEAMLTVISWADAPAGVAVLPLVERAGIRGICIGSGHALAAAHGCRPGAVAVRVDLAGMIAEAVSAAPHFPGVALDVVRPIAEGVAVHELAHSLTLPLDGADAIARAHEWIAASDLLPVRTGADSHGPRWGAALVLLTQRMVALRPAAERENRLAIMRADIDRYGLDADAIVEALGDVADDASVRSLLAPGGVVATGVAAVCNPEAKRQTFIEHRRTQRAAGGVDGNSTSEVFPC